MESSIRKISKSRHRQKGNDAHLQKPVHDVGHSQPDPVRFIVSGKVYPAHSLMLPPGFVEALQTQARRYAALEKLKSRREWLFGDMVNAQWNKLSDDIKAEITKDQFYLECSYWINDSVGFPIVGASGETLRRWAEVAASYAGMAGIEQMRDALSFDHFYQARRLANRGKVNVPSYALAVAIEQQYTAEEMVHYFDPPEPPDEYSRCTGWLDLLETSGFIKNMPKDKCDQIVYHVGAIRELLG